MGAVTPAAFPTAGTVLTATEYNKLPRGVVYYNSVSSSQAGITTTTDITGMTAATWTATSSRLYRTTILLANVYVSATGGYVIGLITDGSNGQKAQSQSWCGNTERVCMVVSVLESGLSGSVTRKGRFNGNGATVTLEASATAQMYIIVEDVGAA